MKPEWDVTILYVYMNRLDTEDMVKDLNNYWDTYRKSMRITEVCSTSCA